MQAKALSILNFLDLLWSRAGGVNDVDRDGGVGDIRVLFRESSSRFWQFLQIAAIIVVFYGLPEVCDVLENLEFVDPLILLYFQFRFTNYG